MRACTQQSKKNRSVSSSRSVNSSSVSSSSAHTTTSGIGKEMLDNAGSRLCGFLDDLLLHEKSMTPIKSKGHQVCRCCGKPAYHCCKACPGNPALHIRRADDHNSCFLNYHNTASFGKWKDDFKVAGEKRKHWHYPSEIELQQQSTEIKRLHLSTQAKPADERASAVQVREDSTWNDRCV